MSSIGIMDPAFFVGKNVLLNWLNEFFEINYTKVEQCASGAIHCQILDCIYPGKVPLKKVNFDAKFEHEFVKNYKVLQEVFTKENIAKHVPVEKLIKGKYQDNLEFLQWIKNFFETKYAGQEYHAKERREQAKASGIGGGASKKVSALAAPKTAPKPKEPAAAAAAAAPAKKPAGTTKPAVAKTATGAAGAPKKAATTKTAVKKTTGAAGKATKKVDSSKALDDVNEEIAKMREMVEGLEKERNFYFGKLREIEILCQTNEEEEKEIKDTVLQILYKTDDEEQFQAPPEEEGGEAEAEGEAEAPAEEEPAAEEEVAAGEEELQVEEEAPAEEATGEDDTF